MRRQRLIGILASALALVAVALPQAASADFEISKWTAHYGTEDPDTLRAGSHPLEITNELEVTSHLNSEGFLKPDASARNVVAELPVGFVGAPNAVGTCKGGEELRPAAGSEPECPINSVIGQVKVKYAYNWGSPGDAPSNEGTVSLFNLRPALGEAARFGFLFYRVPVVLAAEVRTDGDFGINVVSRNISQGLPFLAVATTFWGTPGDPSHDNRRCREPSGFTALCEGSPGDPFFGPNTFTLSTPKPFLTLPTSCSAPAGLHFDLGVESWDQPAAADSASFTTHKDPPNEAEPLGTSHCDRVPFSPEISVQPTTGEAESPTGLEVTLAVPQGGLGNPFGISQSNLKDAKVYLPEGMTLNPGYADGVSYCSAAQIGLTTGDSSEIHFDKAPVSCPDAAQLGEVRIDTPLINEPLLGSAYVAQQDDPSYPGVGEPLQLPARPLHRRRGCRPASQARGTGGPRPPRTARSSPPSSTTRSCPSSRFASSSRAASAPPCRRRRSAAPTPPAPSSPPGPAPTPR